MTLANRTYQEEFGAFCANCRTTPFSYLFGILKKRRNIFFCQGYQSTSSRQLRKGSKALVRNSGSVFFVKLLHIFVNTHKIKGNMPAKTRRHRLTHIYYKGYRTLSSHPIPPFFLNAFPNH